jgi:transcriptional antiterminator NusG
MTGNPVSDIESTSEVSTVTDDADNLAEVPRESSEATEGEAPSTRHDEPAAPPETESPVAVVAPIGTPDDVETPASDDTVTEDSLNDIVAGGGEELVSEELVSEEPPEAVVPAGPIEIDEPEEEEISLAWYILKVQSNRERSISEALRRKIAIEGLDDYFGEVLVPTEKVTEFKGGKKKVVERKLWPGYIAVEMHVNDDTWFAIRETSGIGDFTGSAGKPTPMQPSEVAMILHAEEEEADEAPKLDIKFVPGDKVKVKEGNFENFEGEVSAIDETHGRVTVMLSIFGRPTPVELEYWQVESL